MGICLGVEFGSTRIKAVAIDERYSTAATGSCHWESRFENGIWTYDLDEVWTGLRAALAELGEIGPVRVMGVSAMMHGYLAFDQDWKLLTPFRTWRNTVTARAAEDLTGLFRFNIPQRWSIAHLYQAILNGEAHVPRIAHITSLAGYVHHALTGRNVVGVGDASGIFPIDPAICGYDRAMLDKLENLLAGRGLPWHILELLPEVLPAGRDAGCLTGDGAALLGGFVPPGTPLAPPEGDADTGIVATNTVAERRGSVSAGTSIFAMVALEKPLARLHPAVTVLNTPTGRPAALIQCNNCTGDLNAWFSLLREVPALFGKQVDPGEFYTRLFEKSLEGDPECGGVTVYNFLAGEPTVGFNEGRPLVLRGPETDFTLANFVRAQLYAAMASLMVGMDILKEQGITVDRLLGHGGLFKTPGVAQRYMTAAAGCPVLVMEHGGEGGPYGMALLAAYLLDGGGQTLEAFLEDVFSNASYMAIAPIPEEEAGFRAYLTRFLSGLDVQRAAVERL